MNSTYSLWRFTGGREGKRVGKNATGTVGTDHRELTTKAFKKYITTGRVSGNTRYLYGEGGAHLRAEFKVLNEIILDETAPIAERKEALLSLRRLEAELELSEKRKFKDIPKELLL